VLNQYKMQETLPSCEYTHTNQMFSITSINKLFLPVTLKNQIYKVPKGMDVLV